MKIRLRFILQLMALLGILIVLGIKAYDWQMNKELREFGVNVELSSQDLSQFDSMAKSISKSSLVLFEGLPHPKVEETGHQQEQASGKTVVLQDYEFYKAPLPLKPEDIELLRELCADNTS